MRSARWLGGARAALCAVAVSSLGAARSPALEVPFLSGRVNDYADLVPEALEMRIEARLESFERETGAQVAVLTVPALEGEAVEDFSMRVAEGWKLGREGVDDGVLFLVARDDRRMRIEVGYGLESRLTDAESGRILDWIVRPRFQGGDFGGGIEAGVEAILGALAGEPVAAPARVAGGRAAKPLAVRVFGLVIFAIVVGVFSLVAIFSPGCAGWFLYVFLIPFYFAFPGLLLHPAAGVVLGLVWIVGFPSLRVLGRRSASWRRFLQVHPGWISFAASGWSRQGRGWSTRGGFAGGGSSGGFSGGGGSFGGGGASGSW